LKISGDIKVNGQLINSTAALSSISGYVQQEDLCMGTLKVKEHLKFQVIFLKRRKCYAFGSICFNIEKGNVENEQRIYA
jgi:ABC-type multidrug transport system ATPase subunit